MEVPASQTQPPKASLKRKAEELTSTTTTTSKSFEARECFICSVPEREGHEDFAFGLPGGCHSAHLKCIVDYLCNETVKDYTGAIGIRLYRCPVRCKHTKFSSDQAFDLLYSTWFSFFRLTAEVKSNYVERCADAKRKGEYCQSCPGCGFQTKEPRVFFEHVLGCTNDSLIKIRCPDCSGEFALNKNLKRSFQQHRDHACPVICDGCNDEFLGFIELQEHRMTECVVKCEKCNSLHRGLRDLNRHKKEQCKLTCKYCKAVVNGTDGLVACVEKACEQLLIAFDHNHNDHNHNNDSAAGAPAFSIGASLHAFNAALSGALQHLGGIKCRRCVHELQELVKIVKAVGTTSSSAVPAPAAPASSGAPVPSAPSAPSAAVEATPPGMRTPLRAARRIGTPGTPPRPRRARSRSPLLAGPWMTPPRRTRARPASPVPLPAPVPVPAPPAANADGHPESAARILAEARLRSRERDDRGAAAAADDADSSDETDLGDGADGADDDDAIIDLLSDEAL